MRRRNMQFSFGQTPTVSMRRSKFDLSHGLKTTMNVGTLYPLDITEVLPGDTFKCKETHVVRLSNSYLRPVMDNVWLDMYYFFVPCRILYDDWERVFGNPDPSAYSDPSLAEVPTINNFSIVSPGSVGDYLGLPVGTIPKGISVLPFRAFAEIYNEWFRNENVTSEVYVQKGNVNNEDLNNSPWSPTNYTGKLPFVGKKKDYFTSCLPSPQKGAAVTFPLIQPGSDGAELPVRSRSVDIPGGNQFVETKFVNSAGVSLSGDYNMFLRNGNLYESGNYSATAPVYGVTPVNLWAKLSSDLANLNAISVNDMRMAFALQKMLESDARFGSRYREYILGHFGVTNGDARMHVPEFLGGRRTPLVTQQVAQTSQGTEDSALGSLGAYSYSQGGSRFVKSFTEHGYVLAVGCIRQLHTYQQGINKMWSRVVREDFYDPKFANLGEQPVYNFELYGTIQSGGAPGNPDLKELGVFGYNEAWAEYRYKPSMITGEMRTGVADTLDIYHFADYFSNTPTLTDDFILESPQYFDRTLAVPSESLDNFVVDMWFDFTAYRVMPVYSVPGLIDHH